MYSMKPIFQNFSTPVPNCMYKVKANNCVEQNIPSSGNDLSKTNTCDFDNLNSRIENLIKSSTSTNNSSKMEILEAKQEILLQQLKSFKNRLLEIREKLHLDQTQPTINSDISHSKIQKEMTSSDIVINAHPKHVPYGILAIKNAWKNVNINVNIFAHSSLENINPEARHFEKMIAANNNVCEHLPTINLILIWKNCEHIEMISSPTMYKPIYGEINILRYLARIGPAEYRYETNANASFIDSILDVCYQLLIVSNPQQNICVKHLNDSLTGQKFFGGNNCSIADLALASTLLRMPKTITQNLPSNLRAWNDAIKKIVQIKA